MQKKRMKQTCFLADIESAEIVSNIASGSTWLEAFKVHNNKRKKNRK